MGVDIEALVAWGISIGSLPAALEREDWEDVYARNAGLGAPQQRYSESNASEWQEYWRRRSALLEGSGCTLQLHGDEGQYHWCAIVTESVRETSVSKAPLQLLVPTPPDSWHRQLETFCNTLGIECAQPGWLLVVWVH